MSASADRSKNTFGYENIFNTEQKCGMKASVVTFITRELREEKSLVRSGLQSKFCKHLSINVVIFQMDAIHSNAVRVTLSKKLFGFMMALQTMIKNGYQSLFLDKAISSSTVLLVVFVPFVFESVNFVSTCTFILLCSSLIHNFFNIIGWNRKVMDELESMQKKMAQLEAALQKAIVDKHKEVEVGLSLLHERENLRLKLGRMRAKFLTSKVEVNQANQILAEVRSQPKASYRGGLKNEKALFDESSNKGNLPSQRVALLETNLRNTEQDSVPGAVRNGSGKNHLFSVLARVKHEDLKEKFEEKHDHFKPRRKWANDSVNGELSNLSAESEPLVAKVPTCTDDSPPLKPISGVERMVTRMGREEGKGFRKLKQGVTEPVTLSTQRERVGLGHVIDKSVDSDLIEIWDESKEEKTIQENVYWLPTCERGTRDWLVDNLERSDWIQIGEKKTKIDDETEFCDGKILRAMIKSKEVFNAIPDRDLRDARTRANPYETIRGAFFQNRSAMKVANLDKVFGFILSGETEESLLSKNPLVSERPNFNCDRDAPLFYFADVCGGPGGFSEYMLWRKAFCNAKGFGFTLKGKDDFNFGRFTASSAYYLEPYYGKHGDGDTMNPENIDSFEKFVMRGTNGVGVDLMMADGAHNLEGSETIQEIVLKRLCLCQLLVSLCIVREKGTFFCTFFDVFTPFSAGLIYLMRVAYDQVSLHKPHSSRPANSERYIICKGLRKKYSDVVCDYLKRINLKLDELAKANSSQDVVSIVPLEIMRSDEAFTTYLKSHNERIAVRQSTYLRKYLCYTKNKSLVDKDQAALRSGCLKYWLVPNKTLNRRGAENHRIDPDQYLGMFAKKIYGCDDFNARLPQFTVELLTQRVFKELKYAEFSLNILSNRATTKPELLISTGDAVYVWKMYWEKMDNNLMRIPDRTVLLVERATSYKLVDKHLETVAVDGLIRILDAAVINGDDVSALLYSKRMAAAQKFCKALQLVIPKVRIGLGLHERYVVPYQLVTAESFTFDQLPQVRRRFSRLRHSGEEVLVIEENGYLMICEALRVARLLKESWKMGWSSSNSRNYAFCPSQPTLGSFFEQQWEEAGCCSSFWECSVPSEQAPDNVPMQSIWSWENSLDSNKSGPNVDSILCIVAGTNQECGKN